MFCRIVISVLMSLCLGNIFAAQVYDLSNYGVIPGGNNLSKKIAHAIEEIRKESQSKEIVLRFQTGRYDFYAQDAVSRMYYISNHAEYRQEQLPLEVPIKVAIPLEGLNDVIFDGNGSLFICHDCLLPLSLVRSENCVLKNFHVDYQESTYPTVKITNNDGDKGITFQVMPDVNFKITKDSILEVRSLGQWGMKPFYASVYEGDSKRVAYNTGDIQFPNKSMIPKGNREIYSPTWKNEKLAPGMVVMLRTWDRPVPALFLHNDSNTKIENVEIHHSQGMGLLAQLCDNVTLDGFKVCFGENGQNRYITTIVDATHFSHCKGVITSRNGYYENMGDDAINVHGIYLAMTERSDDYTIIAKFAYEQTYGFMWGNVGDTVQFISRETSEIVGSQNRIAKIVAMDDGKEKEGMRSFKIVFENPLDESISGETSFSVENLTWTPEVYFTNNIIRYNRARGSLITTPRKVVIDSNIFDHIAGSAILISGDCSYWQESGACRDVVISNNKFINVLTSIFLESNAIISISPLVKNAQKQKRCYHGGSKDAIKIINNEFDTFDSPIVYARSVDGLLIKDNTIKTNTEYQPFHWNKNRYHLEHVERVNIE